jgi:CHAT domain-containing protein
MGNGQDTGHRAELELRLDVVWGDITKVDGDMYAVGHYQGVLPQYAEKALDDALAAGTPMPPPIAEHTRRGLINSDIAEISLFPWPGRDGRVVAVCGMGTIGTFDVDGLRRLSRRLVLKASCLANVETLCSVLIGSGEGLLTVEDSVAAFLRGVADACDAIAGTSLRRIVIAELFRDRAQIARDEAEERAKLPDIAERVRLNVAPAPTPGVGGRISREDALASAIGALARAATSRGRSAAARAARSVADGLAPDDAEREVLHAAMKALAEPDARVTVSLRAVRSESADDEVPTRIAVSRDDTGVRAAAITDTSAVPERTLHTDTALVQELIQDLTDPSAQDVPKLSRFLTRILLPRDFRELLKGDGPLVVEVDREMAAVPWEMLADLTAEASDGLISLRRKVARQLRTAYSGAPVARRRTGPIRRALVIGDPGDPELNESLPGARVEARHVAEVLEAAGVAVTALIGAPGNEEKPFEAARRLRVLQLLLEEDYDLLHYCGHGDFDPRRPDTAGWVFAGGLITARELEAADAVPPLVVANACLSGRTSSAGAGTGRAGRGRVEATLMPSIADEFFRRGVRDYVGTAQEIDDDGAIVFATAFYDQLLGQRASIGEAVLEARKAIQKAGRYGTLWATYQHYGDPVRTNAPGRPAQRR